MGTRWLEELEQKVLRALIPRLDAFEALVDYGQGRVQALVKERGLDWDSMSEQEREEIIDELLHQGEAYLCQSGSG
jgi:hypothetical protein